MIVISLSKLPHQNREGLTGSILFREGFVCLGGGRHPYMYSPRVFAWLGAGFSIGQPQPRETLGGGMREVGHTTATMQFDWIRQHFVSQEACRCSFILCKMIGRTKYDKDNGIGTREFLVAECIFGGNAYVICQGG